MEILSLLGSVHAVNAYTRRVCVLSCALDVENAD